MAKLPVITCDAWLDFGDKRYTCIRTGIHDGEFRMHVAMVQGEYTNWSDSWHLAGRGES